jgi:predicted Zn-ribbon and HTH transcriptional regulator
MVGGGGCSCGGFEVPKLECKSCGYEWQYTGELELATCPSCNIKNSVENQTVCSDAADAD